MVARPSTNTKAAQDTKATRNLLNLGVSAAFRWWHGRHLSCMQLVGTKVCLIRGLEGRLVGPLPLVRRCLLGPGIRRGPLEPLGQVIGGESTARLQSGREPSGKGSTVRVMDIILIGGLWLPASIWADVAAELNALGHRPIALALPGVDDGSTDASLDDQLAAALAAVDAAQRPLVVAHSAACTLAWLVADRRPDAIAGVVMIGGFPAAHGSPYADFFPAVDGAMPFPGWEPFDGPDSDDLDHDARAHIESVAVPVPATVSTAMVELFDNRRLGVPVVLVCPEFSAEQAKAWLAEGQIPELANAEHLSFVDINSGHWPMVTRPDELARLIDDAAKVV